MEKECKVKTMDVNGDYFMERILQENILENKIKWISIIQLEPGVEDVGRFMLINVVYNVN